MQTSAALQGHRPFAAAATAPAAADDRIASWAEIIAVPTAITGFYGQNLPDPGFATHAGVVTSRRPSSQYLQCGQMVAA
jgi:hypothetical protein